MSVNELIKGANESMKQVGMNPKTINTINNAMLGGKLFEGIDRIIEPH